MITPYLGNSTSADSSRSDTDQPPWDDDDSNYLCQYSNCKRIPYLERETSIAVALMTPISTHLGRDLQSKCPATPYLVRIVVGSWVFPPKTQNSQAMGRH